MDWDRVRVKTVDEGEVDFRRLNFPGIPAPHPGGGPYFSANHAGGAAARLGTTPSARSMYLLKVCVRRPSPQAWALEDSPSSVDSLRHPEPRRPPPSAIEIGVLEGSFRLPWAGADWTCAWGSDFAIRSTVHGDR